MCGRYSLVCDAGHLQAYYDLANTGVFAGPRFNIAPTQQVPAIVAVNGERHLELFHWGLIPSWADDSKLGYSTINARAETVGEKPAFRAAFRHRRCLIPADGFYEWQGEKGHKHPWRIEPDNRDEFFSFAGLWAAWESGADVIRSCTIIAGPANLLVQPISDRMPVMVPREAWALWLDPDTGMEALQPLLKPPPAEGMRAYRVGEHVNNPNHDDPACLFPA
ncbi:MAG: hypothetical protein CVV05_02255 [Gammaproteobacteria bacterium HGW-Gammaproteobacteria-1]|jgi:putative SOS response-associated peptidase YedK|nr:MAG: hypothetical protein CVV05_02255 [Gammaproteobacteria bacterium HGW-Gammaproteobacteria-1]